jgi:hypothetical protein
MPNLRQFVMKDMLSAPRDAMMRTETSINGLYAMRGHHTGITAVMMVIEATIVATANIMVIVKVTSITKSMRINITERVITVTDIALLHHMGCGTRCRHTIHLLTIITTRLVRIR